METFFGRIKNEMYYGYEKDYSSFEEFSKAVEEYIDYYNNKRIQAKTKWMLSCIAQVASILFLYLIPLINDIVYKARSYISKKYPTRFGCI
jgi:transposase InsO family protein